MGAIGTGLCAEWGVKEADQLAGHLRTFGDTPLK